MNPSTEAQQSQPGAAEHAASASTLDALRAAIKDNELALTQEPSTGSQPTLGGQLWSPSLVMYLGGGVLAFGLLISLVMAFLLRRERSTDQVLRTFCIPLIIITTVFLVIVGYTDQQIAPVIGLLGTIAGYLLGRGDARKSDSAPNDPARPVG